METNTFSLRRRGLVSMALATALFGPLASQAQSPYPARPVMMMVPFSPGGGTDISARLLANKLGQISGQSFVVENRPGAGGQIAADAVARATADGYTLLFANSGMMAINPWIYKLTNDPATAFEPVAMFSDLPFVLVTSPNVKAKNVQELIALANAEPGKLTFASSGNGGAPHLSGELFQEVTGTEMVHVPYKGGGPAIADLMAGHVDLLFASVLETVSSVKSGKIQALAVTGPTRSAALPDVPTFEELGLKDAQLQSWTAVLAPKGTPPEIVAQLSEWVRQAADMPDVKESLTSQGAGPHGSTPEELAQVAAANRAHLGEIIRKRQLQSN